MKPVSAINRTRIKICGINNLDDAMQVARSGADALGLVMHKPSPRSVDIEVAAEIRRQMPAFITVTALFLDESADWIQQVIDRVRPDCLQFHGTESPEFCQSWNRPYIKAIPMGSVDDIEAYATSYPGCQGFLLDSHVAGRQGGSGDTFDWSLIPSTFQYPLILAGGLSPSNVAEAVTQVQPWAVDVSSGVESEKGVKDRALIRQFCEEVLRVDCQR